ncbi:uncharacterized protein BO80DRAFT_427109 [Aspergillus ibericus CBS 121593]|uniref:Uncharacterized protein n=1 Tax=Aspergillus ibericus CBS 121593 TaxID=1448316 RepID=A0A395GUT5_9EURO|nr:hypothetical protein BO80DRAFT_427109 [Aspergillus ibericus CBS 121593]RAK98758.1 hypothetical protein BO80DRAFT_427109 [Aspergillus ibericus CBS 121593]
MTPYNPGSSSDYIPLTARQTSSERNDDEPPKEHSKPQSRKGWKRFDLTSILTVFLGSTILLLGLILLAIFWRQSRIAIAGDEPAVYWIRVVNANWSTRLVTVCAAAIRTVIALQAGLVTAMVAGIAMETTGIPLLQGPIFSMIRAVKVAPSSLLTATDFRPHLSFFIGTLVVIEVLVTGASQFLSTIFLSDFADGTFTLPHNSTNISLLQNTNEASTGWWTMPPAASWTFAELSDPFEEGPGYHDTGHTYRAFLPFDDGSQRTRLRRLDGPVPVMDHRVVCASPSLINLALDASVQSNVRLSGQIAMKNKSYPMLLNTELQPYINFTCQLPIPVFRTNHTVGESSICYANSGTDWMVLLNDPLVPPIANDTVPGYSSSYDLGYPQASTMFMVLDVVSTGAMLRAVDAKHTTVQSTRSNGPWAMVANGSDVEILRISACLTNMGTETLRVSMNSSSDNTEPKMSWDSHANGYRTEASRQQLGASKTRDNFITRGVLTLEPKSQWQTFALPNNTDGYATPWFFLFSLVNTLPTSWTVAPTTNLTANPGVLLSKKVTGYTANAHLTHVDMFQDTLNMTASPALAMQVLLTRISQMAYYEQLVKLDAKAAASTAFFFASLIPVQWTGFSVGTALVAIHFIIVSIIAVQFLKFTEASVIGSFWQTVSQLASNENRPILEQADRMNDSEVKRWAKHQMVDLKSRHVLRCREDGRIVLSPAEGEL